MMAGNPNWWSTDHSNIRSSATSDHHHQQQQQQQQQQEVALNFLISQTHPNSNSVDNQHQLQHQHHLPVVHQYLQGSTSSSSCTPNSPLPFITSLGGHDSHHFPHSWSQLLLGGMGNDNQQQEEEMRFGQSLFQSTRVMSNSSVVDVKEEVNSQNKNNLYGYHHRHHDHDHDNDYDNHNHDEEQEAAGIISKGATWSHSMTLPITSSPKSCVTSLSSTNNHNNILDFSTSKRSLPPPEKTHQHLDHSNSECNSSATGGVPSKKPKVQPSSNPPLKVRKEKLGDRITSLHQLVSPFGKTDTASVLLEAIGYIRFLQAQIQALSSPYLGGNNASAKHPNVVHGERSCLFPDHPGQEKKEGARDLKSRGLCLVPISCTQLVGSENGADYWAPSFGGGF